MIANEEYLFHITDLSVRLSNSFFWPTEVSLHQIVELVVVRREEISESGDQLVGDDWVLPALTLVQAVLLRLRLVAVEALSGVEVKLQDGVIS